MTFPLNTETNNHDNIIQFCKSNLSRMAGIHKTTLSSRKLLVVPLYSRTYQGLSDRLIKIFAAPNYHITGNISVKLNVISDGRPHMTFHVRPHRRRTSNVGKCRFFAYAHNFLELVDFRPEINAGRFWLIKYGNAQP